MLVKTGIINVLFSQTKVKRGFICEIIKPIGF